MVDDCTAEWTTEEWVKAWTIHVGKAYTCHECNSMVMVTKGGVGALEPRCCGKAMAHVAADRTVG